MADIGILGAGTWGIALARMLCINNNNVTVWSAISDEITNLSEKRTHPNLPGMKIPESIAFTESMSVACGKKDLIIFAVPSVFIRSTAEKAKDYIQKDQIIVCVAKGIEAESLMTMSEVIGSVIKNDNIVALSGPTHAEEVSVDLPTAIVAASENIRAAERVQDIFMNRVFRVYTNSDIKGVEISGALKNVIALAAGISEGLGYGDNAKAALITRGIAEISRLGIALGCKSDTFYGLAGIGDLIVTCTSRHSRNNRAGELIGQGLSKDEAIKQVGMVVEGIYAIDAAIKLSEKLDVELPIIEAVDRIINKGQDPREAVDSLMMRGKKDETHYSR